MLSSYVSLTHWTAQWQNIFISSDSLTALETGSPFAFSMFTPELKSTSSNVPSFPTDLCPERQPFPHLENLLGPRLKQPGLPVVNPTPQFLAPMVFRLKVKASFNPSKYPPSLIPKGPWTCSPQEQSFTPLDYGSLCNPGATTVWPLQTCICCKYCILGRINNRSYRYK